MKKLEDQPIFAEYHYQQLQKTLLSNSDLASGYFVTLRHKSQSVKNNQITYLTDSLIVENWKYFLSFLNTSLFGQRYKRKKKKVSHLSVEHKHNTNIFLSHIHTILFKPLEILADDFTSAVKKCWNKTLFGTVGNNENMVNVQALYSNNVITYQFKDQKYSESLPLF